MNEFPKELTQLKQWICWRMEKDKNGRDTKVPYSPNNTKKASSTNPSTWATFEDALAATEKYGFSGLGFVFTAECGIVGVDIDHCIDPATGKLNETAEAIVARLGGTYAEISPSGTGLHILMMGSMPKTGNKNTQSGVEMYSTGRYFTMTGSRFRDAPLTLGRDDDALAWVHENYVKPPKKAESKKKSGKAKSAKPLTDAEVLERAGATDGFIDLWQGNWQAAYPSQSEADMALVCKLVFWTNRNRDQVDRLFRQSALMREKWDTVHHSGGETYGAETINRALEVVTSGYQTDNHAVFEYDGRYFRTKETKDGPTFYPISNFVFKPGEMLVAEDETQITADAVTTNGAVARQTLMTTDFSSTFKFKNTINKTTMALGFTGSDGDLELLKVYLNGLDWERKTGVKAAGIYKHGGRWVFVAGDKAVEAGGGAVGDIVQLENYRGISGAILDSPVIKPDELKALSAMLFAYNEPAKTVGVAAWAAGCFIKEHLRELKIKFPHLAMIGECGSGKSSTGESVLLPIFGMRTMTAAPQVTQFTLMEESASSKLLPQALDEFKPSKIYRTRLALLYNHFRDTYDGHVGRRGRSDQSIRDYHLTAPLVIIGEESPDEAAIRERCIELLFSKKDLKSPDRRKAFKWLKGKTELLTAFGRGLLDTALATRPAEVGKWFTASESAFDAKLPSRIVNNLQCCAAGLRLIEKLCASLGLAWGDVFGIPMDACFDRLKYGAHEYLLDGNTHNKGVIEQTLEEMARKGLGPEGVLWKVTDDGNVAIRFDRVYDDYTEWRRNHAVSGECLVYKQFMKQLRNSDLYVGAKSVRFNEDSKYAQILDFVEILRRCDLSTFAPSDLPEREEHDA